MRLRGDRRFFATLVWIVLAAIPATARTVPSRATFDRHLREAVKTVPAFAEIARRAEALGLRVWLFGGAAATVASTVRRRLTGDDAHRTPLALDELFHSAQDIDVAVDGPEAAFAELEAWLRSRPPFLPDGRSAWELRHLRRTTGPKGPLLGDPTFFEQHSDTQSTGVLALDATDAEPVLRDLAAWDRIDAPFVEDARRGTIRFLERSTHGTTPRAQAGLNPPMFAAVRYWTKVLGLALETRPEDEARTRAIVDAFDPEEELSTPYARYWLERNGKKLLLYAVDLEHARAELDRQGLAPKLVAASRAYWTSSEGRRRQEEEARGKNAGRTLEQWLDRKPLPGFEVGTGDGPTAESLGLDRVAHETADFPSWEILERSADDAPNLFTSRPDREGENAHYGEGFYVREGASGARNTGFTVRFRLRPEAREGTDFERVPTYLARHGKPSLGLEKDFVVVKNRRALELVRDDGPSGALEFIRALAAGTFSRDDGGLIERQMRRLAAGPPLSADEELLLRDVAMGQAAKPEILLGAWIRSPWALRHPEPFDRALERIRFTLPEPERGPMALPDWLREILTNPVWIAEPQAVQRFRHLLESTCSAAQYLEEVAEILAMSAWREKPEWVSLVAAALRSSRTGYRHRWLAKHVFVADRWLNEPEAGALLLELVRTSGGDPDAVDTVVDSVLAKPGWEKHPMAGAILLAAFEATPLVQHLFLAERMDRALFGRREWQKAPSLRALFPKGKITGSALQHRWREGLCSAALAGS